MTGSHSTDPVDGFLRSQRLRHRETRRIYGHILRAFCSSVLERSSSSSVSLSISQLTEWLREKRLVWPLHMVCLRARLVERFLEWSHAHGAISTNPFVELHRDYGPRTASIVRALVSDDMEAALQGLRPLPRFGSFLGETMAEYVRLKRTLGYRYNVNESMLLRFDRFLQRHAGFAGKPLCELVDLWARDEPSPIRLWEATRVGRLMSKAIQRIDPGAPIRTDAYPTVRLELFRFR